MVMLTLKESSVQYINCQFARYAVFHGIIVGRLVGWLISQSVTVSLFVS